MKHLKKQAYQAPTLVEIAIYPTEIIAVSTTGVTETPLESDGHTGSARSIEYRTTWPSATDD